MWTEADKERHAKGYVSDAREWDSFALDLGLTDDWQPVVHFVGFRGEEYHSAVKVWGKPDFYHRHWDYRAMADVAPGDVVVFATAKATRIVPWSYDDSNMPDDPAYWERISR